MRRLEDMSLGARLLFGLLVIALAILCLMVLTWAFDGKADAQADEPILYEGVQLDATLLHLDKEALHAAYREQIMHLFGVWLREPRLDAAKVTEGIKIARKAYNRAATQLTKRETELLEQDRRQQEEHHQ